jgi:hypothetical protein
MSEGGETFGNEMEHDSIKTTTISIAPSGVTVDQSPAHPPHPPQAPRLDVKDGVVVKRN